MPARFIRPIIAIAFLVACSTGSETSKSKKADWQLAFEYGGNAVTVPLEHLHVYLVDNEASDPEVFEIAGTGVALTGTFPMNAHVGYGEHWDVLFGKTIAIAASGGASEDIISYVQLPDGTKAFVIEGSMVPEKIEGKTSGLEGDMTLVGTFTLRVRTGSGEEDLAGRFAVHCVTLG
jgi:hypothetical protein